MPKKLRLLVFNLATDTEHQVLGFTTQWLNALAPFCETIDVVTMQSGRIAVADNVRVFSVGKEKGYSEARRLVNFYAILTRLLLTRRYDVCFAHMMPLFAVMGSAWLKIARVPIVLWYTHRQNSRMLRWAERVAWRVVTAVPTSFPFATPKLHPLGHGIDSDFYQPQVPVKSALPTIVQVARLAHIKHQHILLQATQHIACEVVLVGDTHTDEGAYTAQLQTLAQDPSRRGRVVFAGVQTPAQIRAWYAKATIAINLSPIGLFDKAALEAMACGIPTLVSNEAFDDVLGAYTPQLRVSSCEDVLAVENALRHLLTLSDNTRTKIGQTLRQNVLHAHSLPHLIERLVQVLQEASDAH
jgi:glycosyltransferase involved in cell wall biosynthesis